MIVPHGMTLKLDPRDEYQHEPEAASNFNESMYFDVFDRRRSIGAWFRIGNRVNEGHAEVTVCVHLSDGRVAFWFARPQIASNASLDAGGFKVSVVEPFKALHIAYEGEVLILDDAKALRDAPLGLQAVPPGPRLDQPRSQRRFAHARWRDRQSRRFPVGPGPGNVRISRPHRAAHRCQGNHQSRRHRYRRRWVRVPRQVVGSSSLGKSLLAQMDAGHLRPGFRCPAGAHGPSWPGAGRGRPCVA